MRIDDLRFLFAYDRWATRRVLRAAGRLRKRDWPAGEPIGTRTLAEILVHQLGAFQRWHHGLAETGINPRPEREPLPTVAQLAATWEAEWQAFDAWLDSLDDGFLARSEDGVPIWAMLAHVVNHGTQHRSEAGALLTALKHPPGQLDMIDFANRAASGREPDARTGFGAEG